MDMGGKDEYQSERRGDDGVNFNSSNMSCTWQLDTANLAYASMGMLSNCNPGIDSFCSAIWDQPNSVNIGLSDANLHANVGSISLLGAGTIDFEPSRSSANGVVWSPPNGMFKGSLLAPTVPGVLPQFLPQFQVDSGFIERAARFSCFCGGNMGDVMNPFNTLQCINTHSKSLATLQRPQEVSLGNGLQPEPVTQSQKHQITSLQAESYKNESLPIPHNFIEGSSLDKDKKKESIIRSCEGAKQGAGVSEIESDGLQCSDRCGQELSESIVGQSSAKGLGSKKRKRSGQVYMKLWSGANSSFELYIECLLLGRVLNLIKTRELLHNQLKLQMTKLKFSRKGIRTWLQMPSDRVAKMINRGPKLQILLKKNTYTFELGEARQQIVIVLQKE